MASSARLKYKIVKCTSEDPEYPVSELLVHSSQTKGWQTARFCEFPQEIGLKFETPVHLRQVQFLSHQSKIATKIELFTAAANEGGAARYESVQFKRLGYLSLDSNERSQFQARELKSVYVDVKTQFLRISFHKCHVNRYNIVNQVGLIALNCLGEMLGPDLAVGPPPPNPALAPPQAAPAPAPVQQAQPPPARAAQAAEPAQDAAQAASDEMRYDAFTLERIRSLTTAKQRAVEAEDFDEAKRCKEMLSRLRQTGQMLRELEERKRNAVQAEDYDTAKALKVEIDRLRVAIERPQQSPSPNSMGGGDEARSPPPGSAPRGAHQPVMAQAPPMGAGGVDAESDPRGQNPNSRGQFYPHGRAPDPAAPPCQGVGRGGGCGGCGAADAPPFVQEGGPGFNPGRDSPPLHGGGGGMGGGCNGGGCGGGRGGSPPQQQGGLVHSAREAASSPLLPAHAGGGVPPEMAPGMSQPGTPAGGHGGGGGNMAGHPLAGVPNLDELGQPEALGANFQEEAPPVIALFGDFIARCIYSKDWKLREAAVQKLTLDLNNRVHSDKDPSRLLQGYSIVLRRTVPDRNVQVFLGSATLVQTVCQQLLERNDVRRQEAQGALDPCLPLLVEKMGDANARVDKTARDAHMDFSRCPSVGAAFVVTHVLKPPKKKVHARVFSSRLTLLAQLVLEFGVQPDSREGIPLEPTVTLAMEWFNNPASDVRENAVKLVAAVYARVGLPRIEKYLANLRQAQREVFDAEFEKVNNGGVASPAGGRGAPQSGTPTGGRANAGRGGGGGGGLPSPQVPPPRHDAGGKGAMADQMQDYGADVDGDEYDDLPPFVCQFCGREDPSFTPEALDVHYWRECPLLTECEYCQQVIEISTLRAHLCEECESGMPAQQAGAAIPPRQCPLCFVDIGAGSDQDWRYHLLTVGCASNPRRLPNRFQHKPGARR